MGPGGRYSAQAVLCGMPSGLVYGAMEQLGEQLPQGEQVPRGEREPQKGSLKSSSYHGEEYSQQKSGLNVTKTLLITTGY